MRRRQVVTAILLAMLSGCAFYEKSYLSRVEVEGRNLRPESYDEGVFYINPEPWISMRMGCYAKTTMLETMFPLLPLPFGAETEPHASIADRPFSLTLRHRRNAGIDLSTLHARLTVDGQTYALGLSHTDQRPLEWTWEYEFTADLACGAVEEGELEIVLDPDRIRTYKVRFREGVERKVNWHPTFVT